MAVLSKVLFGELERTSVDLQPEDDSKQKGKKKHSQIKPGEKKRLLRRKAKNLNGKTRFIGQIVHRDIVKSPSIMRLTPLSENVHSLKARTDCILFDVLIPNYDNGVRQCRFFKEIASEFLPTLAVQKKLKNESEEGYGINGVTKNLKDKQNEEKDKGNLEEKSNASSEKTSESFEKPIIKEKNNGSHLIEGRILLEEITEPEEIDCFVVVAFPRTLTLKLS